MAQNTMVTVASGAYTEITANDVAAISFCVLEGEVYIRCTTSAAPAATERGWLFTRGTGVFNVSIADIAPGVSGADRVFARAKSGAADIWVSHA